MNLKQLIHNAATFNSTCQFGRKPSISSILLVMLLFVGSNAMATRVQLTISKQRSRWRCLFHTRLVGLS